MSSSNNTVFIQRGNKAGRDITIVNSGFGSECENTITYQRRKGQNISHNTISGVFNGSITCNTGNGINSVIIKEHDQSIVDVSSNNGVQKSNWDNSDADDSDSDSDNNNDANNGTEKELESDLIVVKDKSGNAIYTNKSGKITRVVGANGLDMVLVNDSDVKGVVYHTN